MQNTILLVDDETNILNSLCRILDRDGYHILTASSGHEALNILKENNVQVVISDHRMPYMTGCEFLKQVKKLYPDTVRMLLSGQADFDVIKDAINEGSIYKFLTKPWDNTTLRQHVHEAFRQHLLQRRAIQSAIAMEASLEGIMVTDSNGIILQVNQMFTKITGFAKEEAIGKALTLFDNSAAMQAKEREIRESLINKGQWHGEVLKRRKNGQLYPEWLSITAIVDETRKTVTYTHMFLDTTAQNKAQEKLNRLMYYDTLTNLGNRLFFMEELANSLVEAKKNNWKTAVLWVDLDHFSTINNIFGHYIGDFVLKFVTDRLRDCVSNQKHLARLGNDDFAILVPQVSSISEVEEKANAILKSLQKEYNISEKKVYIHFSIGISIYPDHSDRHDVLMEKANIALSLCKELGGSCSQIYQEKMELKKDMDLSLEADLHLALDKEQFRLFYQPIVSLHSGKITGFEALIRWQNPQRGLLTPDHFLQLSEKNGLIIPIDEWVLATGFHQLKYWHDQGFTDLNLAINLSTRHLNYPELFDVIESVLQDVGMEPSNFILEVTETLIMKDLESNLNLLQSLRDLGLHLALDDFGTGFSSLSYLKKFPFNILKIDKSFVHDIGKIQNSEALLRAIITMGMNLGLTIIAEGVENAEQLDFLQQEGCNLVQGFYFSKPVPAEQVEEKLQEIFVEVKRGKA